MGTLLEPINELNHYYKDTYLSININDIKMPFYVKEFKKGNSETYIICEGTTFDKTNIFMWIPATISAELLNYEHPEVGYINAGDCACYVSRAPVRQFKKGVTKGTLNFYRVSTVLKIIENSLQIPPHTQKEAETIYYLFNPRYYSLLEIINKINTLEIYSGAINRVYAVQPTYDEEVLLLMYKNNKIGYIKNEVALLPKNNVHFVESLSEYMKVEVS